MTRCTPFMALHSTAESVERALAIDIAQQRSEAVGKSDHREFVERADDNRRKVPVDLGIDDIHRQVTLAGRAVVHESKKGWIGSGNIDRAIPTERASIQNAVSQSLAGIVNVRLQQILVSAERVWRVALSDVEPHSKLVAWISAGGTNTVGVAQPNFLCRGDER